VGVGNYCYFAVGSAALGASAPTEGGEGRGISWRSPGYSLLHTVVRVLWDAGKRPSPTSILFVVAYPSSTLKTQGNGKGTLIMAFIDLLCSK